MPNTTSSSKLNHEDNQEMFNVARQAIQGAEPEHMRSLITIALSTFRAPRHHRLAIMRAVLRWYHEEQG